MKIKIISDVTGKPWELAGDGKAGPDSMSASFKRNIEDLTFLRAVGVYPVSRGNKSVDIAFGIWKTFASAPQCSAFCLDLQESVPDTGRVEMTEADGGGQKTVRYIDRAAVSGIEIRQFGTTAHISFIIHGGTILKQWKIDS